MRKGFTLVELLAVIVILSLLTLLTINIVTNIVASGKDEISDNQKVLIEKAADIWGTDNIDKLPYINECRYIMLSDIIDAGYIDDDIYDINTSKALTAEEKSSKKIYITANASSTGKVIYTYTYDPLEAPMDTCTRITE